MSVIATDSARFSGLVKFEFEPSLGYCRDVVVMNDSAMTVGVGTVLGKVTATGKYKRVEATASDGSQTPAAIVIGDAAGNAYDFTLAATTDTKVLVLSRGPVIVADDALRFGSSVNTTPEFAAAYDSLKALGIIVETAA